MCGIVGAYSVNWENVIPLTCISAQFEQNRGGIYPQGVGLSDGRQTYTSSEPASQFYPRYFKSPQRHMSIAGLRYGTDGSRTDEGNIPPIEVDLGGLKTHICHNGQIPYASVLRDWIETKTSYKHKRTTDTETLAAFLLNKISEKGNVADGAKELVRELEDAAFSVVAIMPNENTLVAFRDRNGYRPLYVYQNDKRGLYAIASEDPALSNNPYINMDDGDIREVQPGEVIVIDTNGLKSHPSATPLIAPTPCKFERIYFARPDTDDGLVCDNRVRLGKKLHELNPVDGFYHVIPDSESGDYAAMGYAHASGMPMYKATPKERYPIRLQDGASLAQRSFMTFDDISRRSLAGSRLKLNRLVADRDVFVTDSVIRGTVIRQNLNLLHAMGAKEVHVRVTFPPTTDVCHQGIDFRGAHELVMGKIDPDILDIYKNSHEVDQINAAMQEWANVYTQGSPNVASFCYMPIDGFEEVVGKGCMRCLGKDHDGGRYDGQIKLPPFLREFSGREYIQYY